MAVGLGDVDAGADGGRHGLLDEVGLPGAGLDAGVDDGALLHLGDAGGHADQHPGLEELEARHLADELPQHLLRHVIVGDDALPQGADGHDVAGGPAQHGLGLGAHFQELAGVLIHGNDGGFVEDHALALHIDQDGCRPQVDADVFRPGHNSTSQKKFSLYRLRAGMARLVAHNLLYL